ncbi:chromodomain-helicase-DNA-binding protein 7 [Anopheles funestus]|uniref:chromodomain-helicase-DNA-binding protein 7 n=1 Tax=Anopheles funestus TaxID=62324 RepID=UPI0020C731D0|nr:chromodomain-helicase-DNA-binding protein 7 [Anopheles funestus]
MELTRRQFNLITTTGKMASTILSLLFLLATIVPYRATVALPEGTFPVAKRMNIETCLVRFDVHLNTIIRTEESRSMGARFLDDADLNSREQCLRLCCETENCDVFVFEEKSPGTCFLFQCGPPENFRCKFTRHSNYTSAVLSMPPPPPPVEQPPPPPAPLAAQIQSLAAQPAPSSGVTKLLSQHEMELVSLKDGGNGKLQGTNFAPASSTTPLPPLGVRLGEILTTPSASTPKLGMPAQQCGHFEFPCHSGECIAVYNVCDGIPQCEDGSDEGAECPQKSSAPIISSPTMQGREQGSGHGRASMTGGLVNQPVMMIPSVRGGTSGNNPIGMGAQGMLPLDQRMYQPLDYQQPPNRFGLSLEQQQQMHRNREDPMTAPKPWPRPAINEPNYVDSADSHIFNHKGGLQLSAVNNLLPPSQQYQETLPESSYMPSSSVIRGGGGKSYLTMAGSNGYPQQPLPQFPAEQTPQQMPPYKSVLPSQWMGSNNMRASNWPLQPGDGLPSGSDGVPPREQYIQPPVQQKHPSIADMQSTSNGADASSSSSITLQQTALNQPPPSAGQWTMGSQAALAGTPTPPGTPSASDGSANRAGLETSMKEPSPNHESLPSAAGAAQGGAKHKPPASVPSDGGTEYEEDAYDDTYPESTNVAGADEHSQPPTQTEPPKKKVRKHHKHDHDHGKQAGTGSDADSASEQTEQKKKKKTKTIKKDKAANQADHEIGTGHHTGSDPIVHEHLKALHKELEIEFADHDGYADRPGGAMLSLTLGVLLTAAMGILLSCRMRVARRRIRRPGKSSYAHDADFLVNGMYL